jgi:hypothetical protein
MDPEPIRTAPPRLPAALVLLLATAPAQAAAVAPAVPQWAALQARHARIAEIQVQDTDVFDLTQKSDNNRLGRLGNRLHMTTREGVIRRALLFQVGDPVNVRRIQETERYLRTLVFLKDARVDLQPLPDGTVRAVVWVRDAWTLKLSAGYQQVGGQPSSNFGLQEQNLMGTGKTLAFSYARNPTQITDTLAYGDPQLFGSSWTLNTDYQHLSNGTARGLTLQRPFTSLDTPWSVTAQFSSTGSVLTIFDRNSSIYSIPSQLNNASLGMAWALWHDEDQAWRPGLQVVNLEARYGAATTLAEPFGLPVPDLTARTLRGPAVTVAYLAEDFRVYRDLLAMDTHEDYNLGWAGSLTLGHYLPDWGSSESAPFVQGQVSKAWSATDGDLLLAQSSFSGRRGPGGWQDALTNLTVTGYWKETPAVISAAHLVLDRACHPDPEDIYYLGATQGLNGYPNNLHPGDARWELSLNQRFLTEQRWWGVVRLGYMAFADLGAIHRLDGSGWSPAYSDLGGGLRFGDLKSSLGKVILVTFSVPLERQPGQDRWQLNFGNTVQF